MIISYNGGRCLLVEERERGAEARSALFFPHTKTSKARTLESKADVIITEEDAGKIKSDAFLIDTPGEYDVAMFMIHGIGLKGFGEESESIDARAYVLNTSDMVMLYVSRGVSKLRESEIEKIGTIDILAVPVPFISEKSKKDSGPADGLGEFVRALEPKAVVIMANDAKLKKAVESELGTDGESMSKLTVAPRDLPEEGYRLVFLETQ